MTIFQLFVYSCVSLNDFSGVLVQKTCRWDPGDHFSAESLCQVSGAASVGQPVFSDIMEQRNVELFRCLPISVITGNQR